MIHDLQSYMARLGQEAKAAAIQLRLASNETRNTALLYMAEQIQAQSSTILAANAADMAAARKKGLSPAMLDRLALSADRVEAITNSLKNIQALPDPVGVVEKTWQQPNGINFSKISVPIGVIGMIYESRPNVTADASGLCIKSGNGCILRSGSESAKSSAAIHAALQTGLKKAGLPKAAISFIKTTDRAAVGELLGGLNGAVDLIIPRGGKSLIARVQTDARIPVLAHLEGLNHSYVHKDANFAMALTVIENAKLRRTGICGATETVLIDADIAREFLPDLRAQIGDRCEIRGDKRARAILTNIQSASEADFATEHLAAIVNVAIVDDLDGALAHIAHYASGHTDAIITDNQEAADIFLNTVDSAIVLHNASTQFADGGEFGFGAEIGIATGRFHARGPVGAEHLTIYKYQLRGSGQTRP